MTIPNTIKIGGIRYQVRFGDLPGDDLAEFDRATGTILIELNLPKAEQEAALFHEILHAMNTCFDDGMGHAFMESLSLQLYQVLVDNKMLA